MLSGEHIGQTDCAMTFSRRHCLIVGHLGFSYSQAVSRLCDTVNGQGREGRSQRGLNGTTSLQRWPRLTALREQPRYRAGKGKDLLSVNAAPCPFSARPEHAIAKHALGSASSPFALPIGEDCAHRAECALPLPAHAALGVTSPASRALEVAGCWKFFVIPHGVGISEPPGALSLRGTSTVPAPRNPPTTVPHQ